MGLIWTIVGIACLLEGSFLSPREASLSMACSILFGVCAVVIKRGINGGRR